MVISFLKKRTHFTKIGQLGIVFLIVALALSFVDTVWAVYIYEFVKKDVWVGLISSLFTAVSLISYIYLIPWIEKSNNIKTYKISLTLIALCYFLFIFIRSLWLIIVLGIILSVLSVLRVDSYGMVVRNSSKKEELSANEGFIYTLMNIGWLIGPLIAGFLADKWGIPIIFFLSGIFMLLSLVLLILMRIRSKDKKIKEVDGNFILNLRDFFKKKELVKTYIISGSTSIWWALIFIYIPVHMIETGLRFKEIAFFLFAVIVPLILFEYYFSKKANKIGFKRLFIIGHIIMGLCLVVSFFMPNILFILIVLICGSLGIAMVEATTEAYFFLIAPKKKTEKYYSIYNTTLDVFSIMGKLLIAGFLLILPFKYAFLLLAVIFAMFVIMACSLKEDFRVTNLNTK
ncbi:MAG: MFS transporter [archaeon]